MQATTTTVALIVGDATADAGDDFVVSVSTTVTLDASRSDDPEDGVLEYTWTQVAGPDVTNGSGALTGEKPEFTAPDSVVSLVFDLTVDDGEVSVADQILVQVVEEAGSAVFVDPDADGRGLGNGTMASPVTSLAVAIGIGAGGLGVDLYLKTPASGRYLVPGDGLELPSNTSVYGGYGDGWVRDVTSPTVLTGTPTVVAIAAEGRSSVLSGLEIVGVDNPDGDAIAVRILTVDVPGGDVILSDVTVEAGNARGTGAESIAVAVGGSFDLTITRSTLMSGDGSAGRDGDETEPPDPSPAAIPGTNAKERDAGGGFNAGGRGGSALAGKGKDGTGNPSSLGGDGGNAGKDGKDGATGGGVGGGTGGGGGQNEPFDDEATGQPGKPGFHGREGGGGGGGGGKVGLQGGGGGGGGEGGRPGNGGQGGFGGGMSLGLLLEHFEGRLVIDSTVIVAGHGGDGGDGGIGSGGTSGAKAGKGARGSCSFLGCGAGEAGRGGDGGGGGAGSQGGQGGGGAGGASIALVVIGTKANLTITASTLQAGTGGTGGSGGFGGLSAPGASGRNASSGLVPDTYASGGDFGAGGGYSIAMFLVDPLDRAPTIEDSELLRGTGGAGGDAPIPGPAGMSGPTNF